MSTARVLNEPQLPLEAMEKYEKPQVLAIPTAMHLLNVALQNNAAIDVIERLSALHEKAMARDAEIQFNQAMNAVQGELGRIAPDLTNPQTHSKYASYAALDRAIRPVYTRNGFSLSFDTADAPQAEMVRVVCYVSHRAGHTRRYQTDMPADGKGAKGGDVMTKTHASGAAMSYGARYLLKFVFNIAVGEGDTDGNQATNGELTEQVEFIGNASTPDELRKLYSVAYEMFEASPVALKEIIKARKARKQERGW